MSTQEIKEALESRDAALEGRFAELAERCIELEQRGGPEFGKVHTDPAPTRAR